MNLFIDTNIYLSFYHYSNEDLEELRKLLAVIKNGSVKIFINKQVVDEFLRNREKKIKDALKNFESQSIPNKFPQIIKEYPEYSKLYSMCNGYEKERASLLEKISDDISSNSLKADLVINDIFRSVNIIERDVDQINKALIRYQIGNPPGKNNSYGDAINWEMLLEKVPDEEDVYLISDDQDYASDLNDQNIAEFLKKEWEERKNSEIFFFRKLSDFFKRKFPEIKLASQLEKETAINNFINSSNFTQTHLALLKISNYSDFSDKELEQIMEGALGNSQISWIKTDEDVRRFIEFVKVLVKDRADRLNKQTVDMFSVEYNYEEV